MQQGSGEECRCKRIIGRQLSYLFGTTNVIHNTWEQDRRSVRVHFYVPSCPPF